MMGARTLSAVLLTISAMASIVSAGDPASAPPPPASSAATSAAPSVASSTTPQIPKVTACQNGNGSPKDNGCGKCVDQMVFTPQPQDKAELVDFDNSWFPPKEGEGGGGQTWFNVPQPPDRCKILIFGDTPDMAPPPNLPGVVAVVADRAHCYYMNTGSKIAVSYCCGNDQCNAMGVGNTYSVPRSNSSVVARSFHNPIAGRSVSIGGRKLMPYPAHAGLHHKRSSIAARDPPPYDPAPSEPGSPPGPYDPAPSVPGRKRTAEDDLAPPPPYDAPAAVPGQKRDAPVDRPAVYSFFANDATYGPNSWSPPPPGPYTWCEPAKNVTGSFSSPRAGVPQLIGPPQHCTGSFCSFGFTQSLETSSAIDISKSQEHSSEWGWNWGVQSGVSMIITAMESYGFSGSATNSITNSTSTTNTTSHTLSVENTLGVQYGTYVQLLAVPITDCQPMIATCHNGTASGPVQVDVCKPRPNATNPESASYFLSSVNFGLP